MRQAMGARQAQIWLNSPDASHDGGDGNGGGGRP